MKNPFLPVAEFPDFPNMTPAAADEALPQLLAEAKSKVDALEKSAKPTWADAVHALDLAQRPLWDAWGCISHLLQTCNSEEWRQLQKKYQADIVAFSLRVDQSRRFYDLLTQLRAVIAAQPASSERDLRLRVIDRSLLGAKLSGVALEGEKQKRFNEIKKEMSRLANDFRNNVIDSVKSFGITLTKQCEVEGLPESIKSAMAGENDVKTGPWRLTLDEAIYFPFMKHSRNRPMREALCRAYCVRAAEGNASDNTAVISQLLKLRHELAQLLGFKSYADLTLCTRTARRPAAVYAMFSELITASKPHAAREQRELAAFAAANGHVGKLEPWDRAFWSERQREKLYSYSEEELSKYFEMEQVLKGLFALTQRLFGVRVEEATGAVPVWHPAVRFFRIRNEKGEPIAHFYFDPYSRPASKSGGAWMNSFNTREILDDGKLRLPLALMCCNQTPPDKQGRSFMRFMEVETLFHEFGHALQHMLTSQTLPEVSGLHLIERDAIEIASQFMENWCYDAPTLRSFARHADTKEPIPESLVERLRAARNYRAATASLGQLCYATTDMELHRGAPPADPNAVKNRVYADLLPGVLLPEDRLLNSFKHIFSGGYASGYYTYKWSEVMSADVFGAFEEAGLADEESVRRIGRHYRDTFLALGGSIDPMEVFRRFRGRAPSSDALLRQTGLKGGK